MKPARSLKVVSVRGHPRKHHEVMENFRGREAGVAAAEAFIRLGRESPAGRLPGV